MALLLARSLVVSSRSRFQSQFHTGRRCFNTNKEEREAKTAVNEFFDGDGVSGSIGGRITRSLIWLIDKIDRRLDPNPIQFDVPSTGGLLVLKCQGAISNEEVKLTLMGTTLVFQGGDKYYKIIKLPDNYNCTANEIRAKFTDGVLKIYFPKYKGFQEIKITYLNR